MKAKELRNSAAAAAAGNVTLDLAGVDPSVRNYIDLVNLITDFYSEDPLELDLSADFWVSSELVSASVMHGRQILWTRSRNKFLATSSGDFSIKEISHDFFF